MAPAWLDSLSEDWVSQNGSDASEGQLPPLPPQDEVETPQIRQFASRIPRRAGNRSPAAPRSENSSNILSERSANEINISMKRLPSKLSQEVKPDVSRSASNGSVVHKSLPGRRSPDKESSTPEWRKRLIHGDMPYGEQRDLFCSPAVGLQDMFKPPQESGRESRTGHDGPHYHDTTLPSSPPTFPQPITEADLGDYEDFDEDDEYAVDVTPSPSPRPLQKGIKYRPNQSSPIPDDRNSNFPKGSSPPDPPTQDEIYRDESCLSALAHDDVMRKPSGQSVTRNEDFSPILIGKHSGGNGNVEFAPIEVPVDQLWAKLERLRINQMLLSSQADFQAGFDTSPTKMPADAENTDEYIGNGGFVNVRRGGRSGDGSFYNRGLSSEMVADTSGMLPEESLQASTPKQFLSGRGTSSYPTVQVLRSPSLPRAPFPSPDKKRRLSGSTSQPENSPLRLFGPYDTFTNQTLLRRISQFEEESKSPSQRSELSRETEASLVPESPAETSTAQSRSLSRFGKNDLEGYEFRGDLSDAIYEDSDVVGKENIAPNHTSLPPYPLQGSATREGSPDGVSHLVIDRKRSKNQTPPQTKLNEFPLSPTDIPSSAATPKRDPASDSKRPITSPSKDPTPKRRRTLHRSDIAFGGEAKGGAADATITQTQSPMSNKKRKDALPGSFEVADPGVLAQRPILYPQGTASSRNRMVSQDQTKRSAIRAPQMEGEAASSDAVTETDRKPSIRTQDFVDQAAQIMAMIRNQVRPELASLEESEEHGEEKGEEQKPVSDTGSNQDSTNEPFSRPPSREGKPVLWVQQRQADPELLSRLKKYQEFSDLGDLITSSTKYPGLANEEPAGQRDRTASYAGPMPVLGEVISDLPNVRITSNASRDVQQRSPSRDYPSISSNQSTSRNFPSASSRGSDSRRTLLPETVSHLIPDRVGSMCLDKDNNVWVKRREPPPAQGRHSLLSEDSEEDPFASIPDLSVDMNKEMQNLRLASAAKEALTVHHLEQRDSSNSPSRRTENRGHVTVPLSQSSASRAAVFKAGGISKPAAPGEGQQGEETGLNNHDDEVNKSRGYSSTKRRNLTISFSSPVASVIRDIMPNNSPGDEDEMAHPWPNRSAEETSCQKVTQPTMTTPDLRDSHKQASVRQASLRGPAFIPRPVSRIDEQDEESTVELGHADRQLSIVGEQSMMSQKTPDGRRASLSFVFNHTPGCGPLALTADDSALIGRNVGKLSLSPLSEFTLNNPDQSFGFEVSYVMGPRHLATGNGSRKVLSMTIRELVDRLGEAEPKESFWEDMTSLDLHDKRLASLHMLDEFCGKLVSLDASANKLNHLEGVPSTVRELKASHNCLTELTSWDHLMNLQYVDISNNEVTSLSALKNLVHLRSIRADNNQLTSLDGLNSHDGLLSLRARNNMIRAVDFSVSMFRRLQDLDLSQNQISSIKNLDLLPALTHLRLSKNRVTELPEVACMSPLRHLDVSDNELIALDVGHFRNLHSLHADRNRIHHASGFGSTRRLDSLSLREQRGDKGLDLGFLAMASEVRKLFLSGNHMLDFDPQVDFLNLQLLELANCGLQQLPEKMGQLMPNLRTLNINFNAVSDLTPLRFIPRLKKILAAGNRLSDCAAVTELLTEFPHLTQLDVRDNPVTLGFYAPLLQVMVPAAGSGSVDPFILPNADAARDGTFASRLDEATKLRRRLHQVALVASCGRLRTLDGLPVCREKMLARDELLQTLMQDGVVPDAEQLEAGNNSLQPGRKPTEDDNGADEETVADEQARAQLEDEAEAAWQHMSTLKSSRWSREGSFA
ncbi:uncharacterized protein UV8b_05584 [Ustilaginoidea virens]|uniref:Uncharacterized protein n=1 Tax=Ustilaginoidea virens TaxID=1159556 RepID=A0A063C5Q1_USTVR|nr:uncharacterized protein UV8b_05584 [Ustilaginoidea virens]QUC21341.1 hypothetical protein UV8b_05584 [Ustilaginoidea virens]GAO16201.1 hypothetical protein UVI_02045070 [Ustilaginoidea virens]